MKSQLTLEQKYDFYERSVQNAEGEVEFMRTEYKRFYGHSAFVFREDFCGTGAMSCNWAEQDKNCEAYAVDLDPEPIKMGHVRHFSKLDKSQQKRVHYMQKNVMSVKTPSYFNILKRYASQ